MNRFESYAKRLTWCIPFLLAVFAAGCGGGRDPILGTGVTPDTTRPTVTYTIPAAGATGVATNTKVTVTFSKDMNPATITATSFTLTGPGTTAVAGAVAYPGGVRTATFTPTSVLAANTLFTATITTGAKDVAGNALASNFVWTSEDNDAADATLTANKILVALAAPHAIAEHELHVTPSIGISTYPADGNDAETRCSRKRIPRCTRPRNKAVTITNSSKAI